MLFSADTHVSHKNIIKYCGRPFANVQEMDDTMVANFNKRLKVDPVITFLGDLCMGVKDKYERSRDFLKSLDYKEFHWVLGNHDSTIACRRLLEDGLITSLQEDGIFDGFYCSHFPPNNSMFERDEFWLHGHSHGTYPRCPNLLDVGVDCWNFEPISGDFIREKYL